MKFFKLCTIFFLVFFLLMKIGVSSASTTLPMTITYNNGVLLKTDDDRFSLKMNLRLQPYFFHSNEDDGNESTFKFRRARIMTKGNVLYPWLKHGIQITLEGSEVALRDATLTMARIKPATIRMGQFKVPFDREFLVSGYGLQLIERSIANSEFALQRDIGLQISGKSIMDCLEYRIGMFNGSGANQNNQDDDFIFTGRAVWHIAGKPYPYWQGALKTPDQLQVSVGFGAALMNDLEPGERAKLAGKLGNANILPVAGDVIQYTTDLEMKYRKLSFEGGYYYRNIDPNAPTTYGEQDANGFFIQGGYFIIPGKLEAAARYAAVEPDNPESINDNEKTEITIGGSCFLSGHHNKIQLNYTLITSDTATGDEKDHRILATLCIEL